MPKHKANQYQASAIKRTRASVIPFENYVKVIDIIGKGESIKKLLQDKTSPHCFPGQPSNMAFYHKLASEPLLQERYATAQKAALLHKIDSMHEMIEDREKDFYTDSDGKIRINSNAVQRDKLIMGFTQWQSEHLLPEYKKSISTNVNIVVNLAETYNSALARIKDIDVVSTHSQVPDNQEETTV
jgi:hypothetical protein